MTTRLILFAAIAAALAAPATATAGGWATVGLDLPPEGLAPGEPWQVDLTILQHGRTPLEGVKPRVIVGREDGGGEQAFPARATGEPGVYHATVVFASAGTWNYRVDDGFAAEHSYPAVRIGGGAGERTGASGDAEQRDSGTAGAAGGSPSGGGTGGEAATAGGGETLSGEVAAASGLDGGRGEAAGSGGDGPDYMQALAAALVAALAAGLGAAAFQRRRGGASPAGG